jgi:hypothetical protein
MRKTLYAVNLVVDAQSVCVLAAGFLGMRKKHRLSVIRV